jgi:hypothetical protein
MSVSVKFKNKWDIIIEKIIELIHHIEDMKRYKRMRLIQFYSEP